MSGTQEAGGSNPPASTLPLFVEDLAALPRLLLARQATMCQGMLRFVIGLEKSLNIIQSLIPMYFNLDSNVLFEQIFLEA